MSYKTVIYEGIGAIKITRVGGIAKAHESNRGLYLGNLATAVGYLINGTCPNAGAALELERIKAQGRVIGKRCGRSQNVGSRLAESRWARMHSSSPLPVIVRLLFDG